VRTTLAGAGERVRRVLGLDGCPTGWVAVWLEDGRVAEVAVVDALDEALAHRRVTRVGIDMPVGLVDGPRDTDGAARERLKGRASSVFSTAPRAVVAAWRTGAVTTHAAATRLCVEVMGQGLSQQAWRLVPKMAEVEAVAAAGTRLTEVHPELAFATIVGAPLPRKRSWPGVEERRRVLGRLGLRIPRRFPRDTEAAPDDVLDAAVCAWVADGLAGAPGRTERVPTRTRQRAHGRPIVITVRHPG
jgi:predicted RNase H-like nuclease